MSRHLHTDELFNDRRSVYLKYDTLKALYANSLGCRTWEKMSEQNTEFKRSSLSLMLQCKSNSMWRKNTRAQKKKRGLGKWWGPWVQEKILSPTAEVGFNGFCAKAFTGPWASEYLLTWARSRTDHLFHQVSQKALSEILSEHSLPAIINPKENNAFCWQNIIFHISLQQRDEKEREKLQLCFCLEQGKQYWGWIPLTQAKWL